jgi:hypothetical protein
MGLDAQPSYMTEPPAVLIAPNGTVGIFGGDTPAGTCRDHAAASLAWAIAVLTEELQRTIQAPGHGNASVEPMFALHEAAAAVIDESSDSDSASEER